MKKYIVLTIIFLMSFCLFGCTQKKKELTDLETIKERGYIIIGVKTDSPPFGFYDKNKLVGMDIDIANEIATLVSSLNDKAIKISEDTKSIILVISSPIIDFL